MKNRLLGMITALALCLSLLPTAALAAGPVTDVPYLDETGTSQTCASATEVTSEDTTWTAGWYVVQGDVTIGTAETPQRVTVSGDVHLILEDDCNFTVNGGIQMQDDDNNAATPSTNRLTIYGQSASSGTLTAKGKDNGAGIGGASSSDCGTITINGGTVTATGSNNGAGIGGGGASGSAGGAGGKITINGGIVTASSSNGGAGIGGGGVAYSTGSSSTGGDGGEITINGGTVTANGKSNGAGIGGGAGFGNGGAGGTIKISGGDVTATGGTYAAGIGGGSINASGSITGGGGAGGDITISGGTVTANGGIGGAGIGGGAGKGGGNGGNGGNGGDKITISGGNVNATGGTYAAGIGGGGATGSTGGSGGNGGDITISGGIVTASGGGGGAYGGNGGAGIGGAGSRSGTNGGSGTFQTTGGNAIIKASSIADNDVTTDWSGIIFEGASGAVYSNPTLTTDLTIAQGETLTIPGEATLTNNGAIYVDGTLTGTVGGAVYYSLTLTDCTASPIYNYNSKTYGKAGETITLTSTNIPAEQVLDGWTTSNSAVTVGNNAFTMPNSALTVTASYANALTIATQPTASQTITYGQTATLSVGVSKHNSLTAPLAYQWYEGSTAITGATGSSYTTPAYLAAGNYTYYCVITCGAYSVTSSNATVAVNPLAEAAPNISIDFESETLTGFVSGSAYTINGAAVRTVDGKLSAADYIGSNISIVTTARNTNHADSAAQALNIPARPAAPAPVGVNETVEGKHDGQITGVDSTMEYRKGAEGSWTSCTGTAVTSLAPGAYQVRVKATNSSFAGLAADVTIATGEAKTYTLNVTAPTFADAAYGYAQPAAQAITITSSGNWQSTITSVTVDSDAFTIDGSGNTVTAGGSINTWTVQPQAGLATGSYTSTITVAYNDGATATTTVGFTVTKAAQDAPEAPVVKSKTYNSVTLEEIPDNANGAKAQYSVDGGTTWQDSPEFTGLSASTEYSFVAQYRETDHYFASPVSAELKVTTGAAPSSGGSSTPTYPPTVEQPDEGGTVTVSPKNPEKGDTVTITPKPEDGYVVDEVTVTDKDGKPVEVTDNGDGSYSFTQPSGKVTITVTFTDKTEFPFVDVFPGDYYYDAVLWAAENGITGGVDDTHFAPNAPCTRAQIVTFLWRAAGSPAPKSSEMPFTDVAAGSYYHDAVLWAVEQGITKGTGDTTFSPDATCTRAQAMTFIYRSVQAQGGGMQDAWMFQNPFSDVDLESYYGEAVMWAVANGITNGTSDTTFSPSADCTRAQIVTFLFRCLAGE